MEGIELENISIPLIKGEKGDKGDTGLTGAKGDKGDKGDTGAAGTTDYLELSNRPTLNNVMITGQLTSSDLNMYTKTQVDNAIADSEDSTLAIVAGDVELTINPTTYVLTAKLENSSGQVISSSSIDLPLESMVVSGRYDSATKKVILTLQNGSTVEFSVADLIDGLVSTTDLETTLEDYVKNTDYATSSTGGVVKISDGYGLELSNVGALRGKTQTYSNYQSMNNAGVICKGTLENVLTNVVGDINSMLDSINGEVI